MADIPVTKKGGSMWLLWLLGGVILIALLVWWFAGNDEPGLARVDQGIVAEDAFAQDTLAEEPAGAITEISAILGADRSTLIGRQVMLQGVTVQSVVSDRVFYVGDGDQRLAIVLNEVATPGTPVEGRYDVTPGQVITVNGVVSRVSGNIEMGALPAGTDVVVEANSLNIMQQAG